MIYVRYFHYIVNFTTDLILFMVTKGRRFLFHISILSIFINTSCTVFLLQYSPGVVDGVFQHRLAYQEKKVRQHPRDPLILEKACRDLVKYGYGFLMEFADRTILYNYDRGQELYNQSLDHFAQAVKYGEKALSLKYPEYEYWIRNAESDLPNFSTQDVSLLYWTAAAYGGAVSASRANSQWLILLPRVGRLFNAALLLNPDWNKGALYSAMISYTVSQPNPPTNSETIARDYFHKAVIASDGKDCSPFLALAEKVSKRNQDKEEFINLLNQAMSIDKNADFDLRLANTINQKRAKWLLKNVDEFFY